MTRIPAFVGSLILLVALLFGGWYWQADEQQRFGVCTRLGFCKEPAEVLGTALLSVQEQQQLVVFSARLITALTAKDERSLLGVRLASARKTLIVPATARYALDLRQLGPDDLHWDAATSTLSITRPPMVVLGPEVDLKLAQEYVDGRLLLAFTNTAAELDRINRQQAQKKLLEAAREPALKAMAYQAADDALRRTFELPLRAAGFDAARVRIVDPTA